MTAFFMNLILKKLKYIKLTTVQLFDFFVSFFNFN